MEQAWKQNAATWSKKLKLLILLRFVVGASSVDNGSTKRAGKATPAPRRALGTGMGAKCSNMEPKAKNIDFTMVS